MGLELCQGCGPLLRPGLHREPVLQHQLLLQHLVVGGDDVQRHPGFAENPRQAWMDGWLWMADEGCDLALTVPSACPPSSLWTSHKPRAEPYRCLRTTCASTPRVAVISKYKLLKRRLNPPGVRSDELSPSRHPVHVKTCQGRGEDPQRPSGCPIQHSLALESLF